MLLILSRIALSLSLISPLVVSRDMFFPFISGKAIFFRITVELALIFFLLHIINAENRKEILTRIRARLSHPIVLAVLIFTGLFVITALTAENPLQAFWSNFERGEGAFQLMHYTLFFILGLLLFETRERLERLSKLHIIVSVIVSLYALGQRLAARINAFLAALPFLISVTERSSGTLGNPSYLAGYLLLTLPLVAYFLIRSTTLKQRLWYSAIMLFEFGILLNTSTRGAFLGLVVGALILLFLRIKNSDNRKLKVTFASIASFLIVLGSVFLFTHSAPIWKEIPLINRSLDISGAVKDLQPRIWTWESALAGIVERPLLGWGAENFSFAFDRRYNPNHFGIESFFDRTHNIFLEYMIAGGVPLLLAFLAIFFMYFRLVLKSPKSFWRDILLVVPVMYFVQGFFLFDVLPIYIALFLFLLFVLNTESPVKEDELMGDSQLTGVGLIASLAILFLTITLMYLTAFRPLEKNLLLASSFKQKTFQDSFLRYQAAIELPSVIGQEESVSSGFKFSLNALEASLRVPEPPPLEVVRSLIDLNNSWYENYQYTFVGVRDLYLIGGLNIRAGVALQQDDYKRMGEKIYEQALTYSPTRVEFIEVLLQVAKAENDAKKITDHLTLLNTLRPDIDWAKRAGITVLKQ